jgi:hypothetical protein
MLDLVVFIQLFILTSFTHQFFAWTITSPLTAAFLGAAYGGGLALVFLSRNAPLWVNARIALPGVLTFTFLTLVATFLHLDKFHLQPPQPLSAMFFAWLWLIIYILAPIVQILALFQQRMVPGREPPRRMLLPGWIRAALSVHAALLLLVGLPLFIVPSSVTSTTSISQGD